MDPPRGADAGGDSHGDRVNRCTVMRYLPDLERLAISKATMAA